MYYLLKKEIAKFVSYFALALYCTPWKLANFGQL